MKWEYLKYVLYYNDDYGDDYKEYWLNGQDTEIEGYKTLDEAGANGWELVAVTQTGCYRRHYFKRAVTPVNPTINVTVHNTEYAPKDIANMVQNELELKLRNAIEL